MGCFFVSPTTAEAGTKLGTATVSKRPVNTRGFDTRVVYGYTRGYYIINHGFTGYPGHPWLFLAHIQAHTKLSANSLLYTIARS